MDHLEGTGELPRAYDHCPGCGQGFSPLDGRLGLGPHRWTPATLSAALRLAVDVPSVRRAAEHFEALTHLPLSKSSLHAFIAAYGTPLAQQEEAEAEALSAAVETPPPTPDAETMAVSLDGVMVHLREEGWKETKVAAVSAVTAEQAEEGQDPRVHLERHSYRAGLWEAPAFAKQQLAEGWRRGLERAARVVAVSDGAAWIWNIVRS